MDNYVRVSTTKDRLIEAMQASGKSQADIVRETGIGKSTISRYLTGKMEPRADAAHKLSVALDVAELWLWGYDVPRQRTESQKKSDDLVVITSRLRRDADFYELVSNLDKLPEEQLATIKSLVAALVH